MKRYIHCTKEPAEGVFWVIDDKLYSYPFYGGADIGVAKSGNTFNHAKLWSYIAPSGARNKSFDYYPRGRVVFTGKGRPVIYMNPNIDESWISEIKSEFGLREDPKVNYDYSDHYKCHLDR